MAVEPLIPPEAAPPPPTKAVYGGFAYFKGAIVPFSEANVSIGTQALNYGTACFEGIRGYWNSEHQEIYLLKLAEHYQRFLKSTALLKIKLEENVERLCELTRDRPPRRLPYRRLRPADRLQIIGDDQGRSALARECRGHLRHADGSVLAHRRAAGHDLVLAADQ